MFAAGVLDRITRVDSPKICSEHKSRDFDATSSSNSPRLARRIRTHERKISVDDSSPASFLKRYTIEDESFAKGNLLCSDGSDII